MLTQEGYVVYDDVIYPYDYLQSLSLPDSDYVYEVFRVIDGIPLFLEDHMERVRQSLQKAGLLASVDELQPWIRKLIEINNNKEGNIKISIWSEHGCIHRLLHYDAHKYPSEKDFREGVRIGLMHAERPMPNAKIFHHFIRERAVYQIERESINEVLLVNQNQQITEGSRSNIFFIRDNIIYTSPAQYVLEGVTRSKILQLIGMLHLPLEEKLLTLSEVRDMDAAFLTGTSRRVLPVREIIGIHSSLQVAHPYIIALQSLFLELVNTYIKLRKQMF